MMWECISVDFITGLPSAQGGYDSIMVVVDLLTKVSHLIPVKSSYTASDIARLFVKEIFRAHGLPKRIVSDRDAKFTSRFWTSLFQAIGTQLCFSTTYHAQTDGQTERVNQVIEDILRAYSSREPTKWIQYLPLVEFACRLLLVKERAPQQDRQKVSACRRNDCPQVSAMGLSQELYAHRRLHKTMVH